MARPKNFENRDLPDKGAAQLSITAKTSRGVVTRIITIPDFDGNVPMAQRGGDTLIDAVRQALALKYGRVT